MDKLRQDASDAAERRALQTHPDVVALRVERIRSQVDGLMWAGLLLGLAFTMVNVQTFAAAGAAVWSLAWVAAWLLDPMVSLVLVAVLRAEQVTARYQVPMQDVGIGPWVRRTKVFAFAATYAMNTWQSWARLHVGRDRAALRAPGHGLPRGRDRPDPARPAHRSRPARRPRAERHRPHRDEHPRPTVPVNGAPSTTNTATRTGRRTGR